MIIYELECGKGHRFEGWFPSLQEFEQQQEGGLLTCAVCGTRHVERIPSGGHVGRSQGNRLRMKQPFAQKPLQENSTVNANVDPVTLVKMVNHFVKNNFNDVGPRFAKEATEMHQGERPHEPIYGTATEAERQTMEDEGIPFTGLPKLPESTNN